MTTKLSPVQKLLKLYHRLFSENKKHYLSDLAKELNCSPQTIIRLTSEIESEYPSCFHTGLDNGRRWYQLYAKHKNKLGLNYQELHYLSLCRELSKHYIPDEISKRIDNTLFQLSTTLLEAESANLSQHDPLISFFHKGMIDYSGYEDVLNNLTSCVNHHYFCHLTYKANESQYDKRYYFAPQRLMAMSQALYVYGVITDNRGVDEINPICLAVHRIKKLDLIKQKVSIKSAQINNQVFGLPWHEPKTMSIHFKKEVSNYIKERIWSRNQIIYEHDNGDITLTIETTSIKETEAWVRSFGGMGTINLNIEHNTEIE